MKNIQYLFLNHNFLEYKNKSVELCANLINVIDKIELTNILHKSGYIYIDSKNIIGYVDRIINRTKKRYYKIEDIVFEYYYDIKCNDLYFLLKKCGKYIFNEHLNCKKCNALRTNININFDIKILENLILCKYHYNLYKDNLKKCFDAIRLIKNNIIEQIK